MRRFATSDFVDRCMVWASLWLKMLVFVASSCARQLASIAHGSPPPHTHAENPFKDAVPVNKITSGPSNLRNCRKLTHGPPKSRRRTLQNAALVGKITFGTHPWLDRALFVGPPATHAGPFTPPRLSTKSRSEPSKRSTCLQIHCNGGMLCNAMQCNATFPRRT